MLNKQYWEVLAGLAVFHELSVDHHLCTANALDLPLQTLPTVRIEPGNLDLIEAELAFFEISLADCEVF